MRLPVVVLSCAVFTTACVRGEGAVRERGASDLFGGGAPVVEAPLKDRCGSHGPRVKAQCDEARFLGQLYVRKLSSGDMVCLEGMFGEEPGGACQARAAIVDVGENRVLMEIRDAKPGSRWFEKVQYQVWYQEGALVDHYLQERGY